MIGIVYIVNIPIMNRTDRQKIGIKRWLKTGGKGTLCYATGVGKTRTALMTAQLLVKNNPNAYILISVPTTYLKEQWTGELIKFNLINNCEVQVINTIITRNWSCDLLIIDEAHRTPSDCFSAIFTTVNYKMILCLTATLERLDKRETLVKQYAPVCDNITLEEAIQEKWVSPIKNYLVILNVDLTEYKELDRKFNSYFAFFDWNYNKAQACLQDWKYRNSYAKEIGSSPKDVMTMAAGWMRALHGRKNFIENHPKKIEICQKILDARTNTKCITFCPTIKFAESIKRGVVYHSKRKAAENKAIREAFNKASTGVINTSKALNEGADISGLTVGIKMNVNSSKITSLQTQGRICRFAPDKVAEMFTIVLGNTQEVKWFNNSAPSEYIVLDTEEKLQKVLNYEIVESRQRDPMKDLQFRF